MNFNKIKTYHNIYSLQWVDELTSAHFFWNENKIKQSILSGARCDLYCLNEAGDCQGLILWLLEPYGKVIEILFLATHPMFIGQGVMSQFLELWLKNQKNKNMKEVWIEVHKKNTSAIHLYRKFNFRVVGERKSYYSDGGDALLMTYQFEP